MDLTSSSVNAKRIGTVAFMSYDLNSFKLNVPEALYTLAESLWLCNHC